MGEARGVGVGRTHLGRVRRRNEDAFTVGDGYWVVADGLGGHPGGDVASRVACEGAGSVLADAAIAVALAGPRTDDEPAWQRGWARQQVRGAFEEAQRRVDGAATPSLRAMGTTLVAALAAPGGEVVVGSVGDSRAYLWQDAALRQVTRDDNQAEQYLAQGVITAAQARTHPGQFILTKALIAGDPPHPPQLVTVSGPGRLLLCTDGLTSELDDEQIAALLADAELTSACTRLVEAAVEAGGRDNVSVLLVDLAPVSG